MPVMGQIHADGQRIESELKRTTDFDNVHLEEKLAASDSFSSTKSNTTSLKMLLAKETSKEVESKSNPPSVIARLMGLVEDFPAKEPVLHHSKRDFRENQSINHPEQTEKASQQQGQNHSMQPITQVIHPSRKTIEYNGVYEGCEGKERMTLFQGQSSQKRKCSENNSGRMNVVPENIRQAKYPVMQENLLHSGGLQEYLDVLSSEKDLFPKFREEPILPRRMSGLHTTTAPPQTRITLLKPMRSVKSDGARQSTTERAIEQNGLETRRFHQRYSSKEGIPSQPSRIILLRPTPGKPSITKAKLTPKATPFRLIDRKNFKIVLDDHGATLDSTGVVHDIIPYQQDVRYQRDESLLSSTHSNGYCGDESSSSDSEIDRNGDSIIDYIEEDGGSFSDSESEAGSPVSKYSWDYIRRYGSSYSGSSSSKISHFPDSLVIKEAKQRLSERWAMVTCEDISQEQVRLPRSTCTLGEMLSLDEVKKGDVNTCRKDDKTGERSQKLPRSKSLPVDTFDNMVAKVQASNPESCKPTTDLMRRVSDFLFSKRKTTRQKSTHHPSDSSDEKIEVSFGESKSPASHNLETNEKLALCEEKIDIFARQNFTSTSEGTASIDEPISLICRSRKLDSLGLQEGLNSTRDQPSPTSVLDAPSEDSSCNEPESSGSTTFKNTKAVSRSSAIEVVACSLSWDDATSESPLPGLSRPPYLPSDVDDDESECHVLVQNIMSSAGFDDDARPSMVFTGWHLPDCPLDPVLCNKLLELREERSYRRLLVDCVNVALAEIGENALLSAFSWSKAQTRTWRENSSPAFGVEVWSILKDWIYGARMFAVGKRDNTGIMMDRIVKQEVEGSLWVKMMMWQVVDITEQIEGGVLEELVAEAVLDFAACCFQR